MDTHIGNGWDGVLESEMTKEYFSCLSGFVDSEYESGKIFPPREKIFEALKQTSFVGVKAVIIGQDPYHGEGQANGLAFAVNEGVKMPPSLRNIFTEIKEEYGRMPSDTSLISWARQGVLLLNTVLTVREGMPQSHSKCGWKEFTDCVIRTIGRGRKNVVYMLWGANAWEKEQFIDANENLILKSAHPSPLSAYRGFFGNGHFRLANEYLREKGLKEIDWTDCPKEEKKMKYTYRTQGTCSSQIDFELNGNIVTDIRFTGGCNGNLKAISKILEGQTVEFITEKLLGNTCGWKNTSCADQLAKAVLAASEGRLNGKEA